MSFVRFGIDGSQVHLFQDTRGPVVCWACHLAPMGTGTLPPNFETGDLVVMLAHLAEHRAAGHTVPSWLDTDLRAEWYEDSPCLHSCSINTPCFVLQRRSCSYEHRCAKPGDGSRDHECACGQRWSCDPECTSASHPTP